MKFTWDENKNNINKLKHKLSFEEASRVFDDDNRIEIFDREHSIDEERYKVIGKVGKTLCVIVTYIRDDFARLISARIATIEERREYEWQWL